jgi:putative phosphoesterase
MRLGLIGDAHAEDVRLETAIDWLKRAGVDRFVCVGDVADGYGDLDRTVALLQQHRVATIRGNHDRWLVADEMRALANAQRMSDLRAATQEFFRTLPATLEIESNAGKILVCHGVGENDMRKLVPDAWGYELETNDELHALMRSDYTIAIGGHTHQRMARRFENLVFVNPGTLHRDYEPGFALLDLDQRTIQFADLLDEREVLGTELLSLP